MAKLSHDDAQHSHRPTHAKLARQASKLLARTGYYRRPAKDEGSHAVDAESITVAGHLRATWVGRP